MRIALLIAASLFPAFISFAQTPPRPTSNDSTADSTARGKYIVDHVAMCVECHTPRNQNGELLTDDYLEGAAMPLDPPPYPNIKWAVKAPAIAGLIGYTKEEGVRLLTEGITRDGRTPSPPMPPFRLTRADAEAVVSYLKSIE